MHPVIQPLVQMVQPESPHHTSTFLLGVGLCIVATGLQNLSMGMQRLIHKEPRPYYRNLQWWYTMSLLLIGMCMDFVALSFLPASVALPLGSLGLVASAVFAHCYLGEHMHERDVLGVALIIVGSWGAVCFSARESAPRSSDDIRALLTLGTTSSNYLLLMLGLVVMDVVVLRVKGKQRVVGSLLPGLIGVFGNIGGKLLAELVRLTLTGENQADSLIAWAIGLGTGATLVTQNHMLQMALKDYDALLVTPLYYVVLCCTSVSSGVFFFKEFEHTTSLQNMIFGLGVVAILGGCALLFVRPHTSLPIPLSLSASVLPSGYVPLFLHTPTLKQDRERVRVKARAHNDIAYSTPDTPLERGVPVPRDAVQSAIVKAEENEREIGVAVDAPSDTVLQPEEGKETSTPMQVCEGEDKGTESQNEGDGEESDNSYHSADEREVGSEGGKGNDGGLFTIE
ncbi:magnesium transporter NIPA [Kipferlia bialata]|uniref:Magnesium transporter NIPA n=1 Tax=Kipferlia bialata TaxID=797122 RepID=A0A9K3GLJ0_9EUKA|nr:magnesium transporter NIPA [Kipferlia bialata]|eukprot:g8705.t1